nr:zinc finger, CCHC-type [Tanacetum cinerariifolium]
MEAVKYHSMVLSISEKAGEDSGNTEVFGAIADSYTELGDLERACSNLLRSVHFQITSRLTRFFSLPAMRSYANKSADDSISADTGSGKGFELVEKDVKTNIFLHITVAEWVVVTPVNPFVVGVTYTPSSLLPLPQRVVALLLQQNISAVRILEPSPKVITTFYDSNITVFLSIPNSLVPRFIVTPVNPFVVGVTYTPSSLLPLPQRVVALLLQQNISAVRILEPSPKVITTFYDSNITVFLSIPNSLVPRFSENDTSFAKSWIFSNVVVFYTRVKENYLEYPILDAHVAPPGQQVPPQDIAAHAAWVKGQKKVVVLMLLTMDLEIQRNLAHLGAYDMLQELKAMYSKQAKLELLQTVREFHTCKQEEGQSISSYVLNMKGYIENLERLGQPVGQNLAVSLILVSLNKDFDSFVQNYNMHGMGKTVNELHAMLKLHEEMLPKKDANPALHAIRVGRVQKNKSHKAGKGSHGKGKGKMGNASNNASFASKPKTPPPPKKDNPAKDAICHQCGEVGHWRRKCPVYLAELMKKKKLSQGASTSGIFTIELYTFPSKS